MGAHRPGPHLCGRLSAAAFLSHGGLSPSVPLHAPLLARRPEQGDTHNSTVTQPRTARGALPLPSASQYRHHAASGSEVRGAAPGDPCSRLWPSLHLLFLPACSCPSPPGHLQLHHPGGLRSSSAGLRCLSHGQLWDAGSTSNGRGLGPTRPRGWPPWAGTGSGRAGRTEPL